MRKPVSGHLRIALGCVLALLIFASASQAQTTTFTYQGSLVVGGSVASGSYDLQFKLYDQLTGGTLQGSPSTVTVSGVAVTNGVFTVDLDFGASGFPGAGRYLEIGVRPAGNGSFTTLSPRQQLTATPYAIRSLSANNADTATSATSATNFNGSLVGDVTGTQSATVISSVGGLTASNVASGATLANNATSLNTDTTIVKRDTTGSFSAGTITATGFSGSGANLTNLNAGNIGSGTLADARLSSNVARLNTAQTFTANQTIAANLFQTGSLVQFTPTNGLVAGGDAATGSIPATGAGVRMMWYPGKYAFRAGQSTGTEWDDANVGYGSMAFGDTTKASNFNSIAMGFGTTSSGTSAVAMGKDVTASGNYAVGIGLQSTASGDNAVALGEFNQASGNNSVALGRFASTNSKSGSFVFNDVINSNTLTATADNQFNVRATGGLRLFASSNTSNTSQPGLFISGTTGDTQINGNLTVSGTISGTVSGLSLTNLNATNISNGTLADARLSSNVALLNTANTFTANQIVNANLIQSGSLVQFTPSNGFVASGTFGSGSIPATGAGARMMWYPGKAAFRAGSASGTQWDDASVGNYSIALGNDSTASGSSAVAIGESNTASNTGSGAFGYSNSVSGAYTYAVGKSNTVSVGNSAAVGISNSLSGTSLYALGNSNNFSSSTNSTAVGDSNTINGNNNYAFGKSNSVTGLNGTAIGESNTVSQTRAFAFGYSNKANANNSIALGSYASTNAKVGSIVLSDASSTSMFNASADNQFNVRAVGGLRFFASSDTSDTTKPGLFISATSGDTQINGNLTVSGSISGTVSGSGITNLNATNVSSGTLADARLSSNVALLSAANTFTASQTINANLIQSGSLVQFTPTNGFVVNKTGSGTIPATGAGTRMMWYPNKAAFRAGLVDGTQWDDANIGIGSVAMGLSATASGEASVAMGASATASGDESVAMGVFTTASGKYSVALGDNTTASGENSTALGLSASTNGKKGSFVYGDASSFAVVSATADNQFVVRAQNIWLGTNNSVTNTAGRFLETSTGAYLTTGGTWTNSSSRSLKTNFAMVNPRDVLQKVLQLPIQTWNYKAEDARVQHIGAISQDFHGLFGFGDSVETISTVDADGVALAAIQGLHEELKDRDAKLEQQQQQLGQLKQQLKQQQTLIDGLRKLLCAQNPQAAVCQKP